MKRNGIIKVLLLLIVTGISSSCSQGSRGFVLQRFQIDNIELDSVIACWADSSSLRIKDEVLVMEINLHQKTELDRLYEEFGSALKNTALLIDSCERDALNELMTIVCKHDTLLSFDFFTFQKEDLAMKYIYKWNTRVVGYFSVKEDKEVILLSNIASKQVFISLCSQYMHPVVDEKKKFDYLYYPTEQYNHNHETHAPWDESNDTCYDTWFDEGGFSCNPVFSYFMIGESLSIPYGYRK